MNHHRDELLAAFNRIEALTKERDEAFADLGAKNSLWASLVAERDEALKVRDVDPEYVAGMLTRLNGEKRTVERERDRLAAEVRELRSLLDTPDDGSVMQVQALSAQLTRYEEALRTLVCEAQGFLSLATPQSHGVTNIRVMQHWDQQRPLHIGGQGSYRVPGNKTEPGRRGWA